ncbi:ATP-binding cassette domain-containing protein [Falsigemmobacter faecalis]|uniref:Nickel import system ATP-binding protein NikD n=1 Tax=Falsigemmobacter faecalis TaxID=2488730 RepID=A0A3P3D8X3_9RHOB|nr:ATP-binding cassette domain-containing protein [Falsigemmobacter faecalis]RRH68838.1 ABC transporter ATP-binding protein [Falsigemmobacter faecalis]
MLSIRHLSLRFRRYQGLLRQSQVTRLSDLSLDVAAGEVLAVAGASGAGKSLLAHAILGLLPPNAITEGAITFQGRRIDQGCPPGLRGRRIALVPQQISHLDPLARVGDQLTWALRRTKAKGAPVEILARFGLGPEVLRLYPRHLSGGMARRVLLAMVSAAAPDLLIADEPTAGLDPENRDMVLALLRGHATRGGAVLLITHDLAAALPFSDRVALLRDGELCGMEDARDFTGTGTGAALCSPFARALWRALPGNGFDANA